MSSLEGLTFIHMMGGGVKALHLIHDNLVIRATVCDVHNNSFRYFLQADLSFVIRVKKKSLFVYYIACQLFVRNFAGVIFRCIIHQ